MRKAFYFAPTPLRSQSKGGKRPLIRSFSGSVAMAQQILWASSPLTRPILWRVPLASQMAHVARKGLNKGEPVLSRNKLPQARVLYVSATGATEVSNMAYATRLGLWGQGTEYPFSSREAFVTSMEAGVAVK